MLAGLMSVHDFPLDVECFRDMVERVDAVVLRLDVLAIPRKHLFLAVLSEHESRLAAVRIIEAERPWKGGYRVAEWLEPKLRALDDVRPDYVLTMSCDEKVGDGFNEDFERFRESGMDTLWCGFEPLTEDGAKVRNYLAAHCKLYRWKPDLTYIPYPGFACPSNYAKGSRFTGNSKIRHYCFWTPELQRKKCETMSAAKREKYLWREPCA